MATDDHVHQAARFEQASEALLTAITQAAESVTAAVDQDPVEGAQWSHTAQQLTNTLALLQAVQKGPEFESMIDGAMSELLADPPDDLWRQGVVTLADRLKAALAREALDG